ncbi:methylated-DNA--[protein]-cysteine S-methyltransferase [Desulfonatronum thiosulfatophilum]|nr:MGMT family protein [Desulfonatronum thiosulfatophilum]
MQLCWQNGLLLNISLRWSRFGDVREFQTEWGEVFQKCLERYHAREDAKWPDVPLAWEGVSFFSRHVLQELRKLPHGSWLSYKELAGRCAKPGASRAVGRVMARNPWPMLIPCHRVLGSDGRLTGFGPGLDMKAHLLHHEGIPFKEHQRSFAHEIPDSDPRA